MKFNIWPLVIVATLSFAVGRASLSADEPPAIVASLPADGQPPAPVIAKAADAEVVFDAEVQAIAETVATASVAEPPAPAEVRELSVEPAAEKRPMLPPDRPAWVGAPNDTSERVHRLYVASFTADSREAVEADDMLDEPMVAAVRHYLNDTVFRTEKAGRWIGQLPISAEFVRNNLLDHSTNYVAAMTTQSGTEYQKWVILQVTPEQREYFAQQLHEYKQRERLAVLGVGLASVLGVTGLANMAFNRRRRRYPNAMTPVSMAIMPGGGNDNAVQYVAAAAAPPVLAAAAPPKKRSLLVKALIMFVAAGLCSG